MHAPSAVRSTRRTLLVSRVCLCALVLVSAHIIIHAQSIVEVTDPKIPSGAVWVAPGIVELTFTTTTDLKLVRILITAPGDNSKVEVPIDPAKREYSQSINLLNGVNQIQLLGFKDGGKEASASATLNVTCGGKKCGAGGGGEGGLGSGGGSVQTPDNVIVDQPTGAINAATLKPIIAVQKTSGIKKLAIDVLNEKGQSVDHKDPIDVKFVDKSPIGFAGDAILKLSEGKNRILVYDPDKLTEKANQTLIIVTCAGDKCGKGTGAVSEVAESDLSLKTTYENPVTTATIQPTVALAKDSKVKAIGYEVRNGTRTFKSPEGVEVAYADDKTGTASPKIRLVSGTNSIRFYDFEDPDGPNQVSAKVTCQGAECSTDFKEISITQPDEKFVADNRATVESRIVVQKSSGIKNIKIRVVDLKGNDVDDDVNRAPIPVPYSEGEVTGVVFRQIRVTENDNTLIVSDADKPPEKAAQATVAFQCIGSRCGVLEVPGSQNYRAIAGFEQAGASSATSQTKPFIDFFFNTPLRFRGKITPADLHLLPSETSEAFKARRKAAEVPNPIPFLSSWGQVRLSTTPEQTAAVGAFPSNLINQITQNRTTVDLVQSFDFMAGLELRIFDGNGKYTSVGTGPRRAHFFLVGGAGAISPLTNKQQSIEIFNVPTAGVERDLFISRFGPEAANKKYIAFVLPERDRFLRQGYVGLRVKTFDCASEACTTYQDRFPAMFQFMFGQNEAVTGGKLKNDVTDSNGKIIGQKRSYILRVDGVFPLSIRGAGFYLYGTAMMKIGGGGVRITTPLFLDNADGSIQVTNPDVFVAPNLQLNRDYYKIGVGFDLMKLFKP